jgi:elongator complex protein 3
MPPEKTMRKHSRTISGVTPVAVMTKPLPCPGKCIFCPTYTDTPQSYTPESPAVLRAINCNYDAAGQVALRLRILTDMGHPTDKIELIVMGGTFLAYPLDYQFVFIKGCFDALNGCESGSLEEAQKINETAEHRCVGLCIETRPDWCRQEEIDRMLQFGATRVELGVQVLDDDIYRTVGRGHKVADVADTTDRLRRHGIKVHYHIMPGLPGATPEKDLKLAKLMFEDERFRPDGLKLYPTMVVEGTELQKWHREGRYQPYDNEVMINLIADIKSIVPGYVRISRVLRDIPAKYITGGLKDSLRQGLKEIMAHKKQACRCIRCREYGHRQQQGYVIGEPKLVRMDYQAAGGREIFLSFEDENETLFGLLRLRIQPQAVAGLELAEGDNMAIVRELHVYGPEVSLGQQADTAVQHRGLGRELMLAAEDIAANEFTAPYIAVLSGVGARDYYRTEFGYELKGGYMVKPLKQRTTCPPPLPPDSSSA